MPYQKIFEPVVKPRENVRLFPTDKYYTVVYVEPIYGLIYSFGNIPANGSTSLQELRILDLDDGWMGQFRILLLDDFDLVVKQPRANERGTTKTSTTRITPYTIAVDPELKSTEFYVYSDLNRIYLQAENTGRSQAVTARILIFGWKFLLQPLPSKPAKYTDIPIATVTVRGE